MEMKEVTTIKYIGGERDSSRRDIVVGGVLSV
jgi:hypothetical protein